jgi:predicted flap endonuclease-1-like 5' DNA nuclease
MTYPACSIWWLLAALLLGWLLCGWFARQYLPRVAAGLAEQDDEIQRLRAELAALRAAAPHRAAVAAPAMLVNGAGDVDAADTVDAAGDAQGSDIAPSDIDVAAARAAGLNIDGPDDLRVIEGVGPKIASIFNDAGIRTFAQIAAMAPADIQPLLDAAGPNFRIADPQTWPEQAALAAANRWAELKALQDGLTGGRKV